MNFIYGKPFICKYLYADIMTEKGKSVVKPVGVIMSLGRDNIGWSLVSPYESFNKVINLTKRNLLEVAYSRCNSSTWQEKHGVEKDALSYHDLKKCPTSIRESVWKMHKRADKYFAKGE